METTIGLTLLSVLATSLLALIGAITIPIDERRLKAVTPALIACAVGVLTGEACLHLLPDALRQASILRVGSGVAAGVLVMAVLELGLRRLNQSKTQIAPVGRLALVAESLHNAIDGALIAGGYLVDLHTGIVATIAVILHEVPHELGNFGVLVHAGYPRRRALALNFASACAAFLGAGTMLLAGRATEAISNRALPIAAGCFLYLALVDLAPELLRGTNLRQRTASGFAAIVGVAFMAMIVRFA